MSGGYRGIVAALTGITLLLAFSLGAYVTALHSVKQQREQAVAAKQGAWGDQRRPRQSDTNHAGVPGVAQRLISNPEPNDGSEREKRDLAAQENTAAWAFWMVAITFGQLALSGIGLWALLETIKQGREGLQAAREGNAATARIGKAQVRAYLSGTYARVGYLEDKTVIIRCCVKNSGQSTARNVRVSGTIFHFATGSSIDRFVPNYHDYGYEQDIPASFKEEISLGTYDLDFGDEEKAVVARGDFALVTVDVTISYTDVFGDKHTEQDRFATMLKASPPDNDWVKIRRSAAIG